MCGIAIAVNDHGRIDRELVERMCDQIVHRGPDSHGYYSRPGVTIGMRRLSIIDLHTGDQPIFNEDRSLAIVFNGEIYNYRSLRARLLEQGHRFTTASDTETVLHLFEEHGPDSLNELNGMFGLAIANCVTGSVFLARDRLGIKPVYYTETASGFYAASEIKCLLQIPDVDRTIDESALDQYLSLLYVPSPRSIFRSIKKLPPGCYLTKEPGKPPIIKTYWKLRPHPVSERPAAELVEQFRNLFDAAVKRHLESDVPLGVFLSGGIDSGALVASMARSGANIQTISLGFPDEYSDFDERRYAKLVADRYGTTHEEIVVNPDIRNDIVQLARIFDEPMGDSGAIPNLLVCQAARKKVKVALSGLGGDELSGGYQRYLGNVIAEHYQKIPSFIRESLIRKIVESIPEPRHGSQNIDRAKRFVRDSALPWTDRYYAYCAAMDRSTRASLYSPEFSARLNLDSSLQMMRDYAAGFASSDPVSQMLGIDMNMYMVDDLLVVADRTSMAASLEVRVPYLDHTLVEFMATVPSSLKLKGTTKKWFLRNAFRADLPAEIFARKKSGFSLPIARWLREDLKSMTEDVLSESRIKQDGLFDYRVIRRIKDDHYSRRGNRSSIIWSLLMFHLWADNYSR